MHVIMQWDVKQHAINQSLRITIKRYFIKQVLKLKYDILEEKK